MPTLLDRSLIILFKCVQLCDLYENDSIFDKFECCLSGDGLRVATGSYRFVLLPCTYFLCRSDQNSLGFVLICC